MANKTIWDTGRSDEEDDRLQRISRAIYGRGAWRSEGDSREIDLGKDFGDVAVKVNGVVVKVSANGRVDWHPAGP